MMNSTEEYEADAYIKGYSIRKTTNDEPLVLAKPGSVEEKRVLQDILSTALSKDYVEEWKTQNVSFVHNAKLENQFAEKMKEVRQKGTKAIFEELAFSVESPDTQLTICEEGPCCRDVGHSLGNPLLGVSLFRHIDVMLRYAKVMDFGCVFSVLVYKVLIGRSRQVVPREKSSDAFLDPTPNYECHLSCVKPRLGDSSFDLLERSTVYLYEYDELTWPVSHPRQCIPYAVVTYCSSRAVTPAPMPEVDVCVKHIAKRDSSGSHQETKHDVKMDGKKMCLKRLKAGCGLKLKILQKEYLRRAAKFQRESLCISSDDKINHGHSGDSRNDILKSVNVKAEESPSDACESAHEIISKSIEGSAPEFAPSAYPRGDECLRDECQAPTVATALHIDNMQTDKDSSRSFVDKEFSSVKNVNEFEDDPENRPKQVDNVFDELKEKKRRKCNKGKDFPSYNSHKTAGKRCHKVKGEVFGSDKSTDKGHGKSKKLKVDYAYSADNFAKPRRQHFCDKSRRHKEHNKTKRRPGINSKHTICTAALERNHRELPKFVCTAGKQDIDYTNNDVDIDEVSDVSLVVCEMEISDEKCPGTLDKNRAVEKSNHHVSVDYKTLNGKHAFVSKRKRGQFLEERVQYIPTHQYTLDGMTYVYSSRFSKPPNVKKVSQMNSYESNIEKGKTYYYDDWSQIETGNSRIEWGPILQKESVKDSVDNRSECMSHGKKLSSFEALNKMRCLLSEVGQCSIDTSTILYILNSDCVEPTSSCGVDVKHKAGEIESITYDELCGNSVKDHQHYFGSDQMESDLPSEEISKNTGSLVPNGGTYTYAPPHVESGVNGQRAGISEESSESDAFEKIERHPVHGAAPEQVCNESTAVKRVQCNRPLTCPFNTILPTAFKWKLVKLDLPLDLSLAKSRDITPNNASGDKSVKPKFNSRTLLKGGVKPRYIPLTRSKKVQRNEITMDPRVLKPSPCDDRQPRHKVHISRSESSLSAESSSDSGVEDTDRYDLKDGELIDSLKEIAKPPTSTYVGVDDVSVKIYDLIDRYKNPELGKPRNADYDVSCDGQN